MTWPRLRFDQPNLAGLCAERAIAPDEYHLHNQLYGFHEWIKAYAGLPVDRPLPWVLEHAITFGDPVPYAADRESALPIVLAVNDEQARALRPCTRAQVEPIGSAFFYVRAVLEREADADPPPERRGTLVFPDKSTTEHAAAYDRAGFAARLAALPAEYQPVYVNVFWGDYVTGAHRPFTDAGLPVITSGHPYDPMFLRRQLDTCASFRYACANDLSTSFCLAILGGCRFFYLPTGPISFTRGGKTCAYAEEPTLALPAKRRCVAAAPFPPRDDDEQRQLALHHAGARWFRPPEFFRELAERGRRLLHAAPPPTLWFHEGTPPDRRAPWLLHGVGPDGVAARTWGFHALADSADSVVEVRLHVAGRGSADWRGRLVVELGPARHVLALAAGCWRLVVPVPAGGEGEDVLVHGPDEVEHPGDPRRRSLAIVSIRRQPLSLLDRLLGRASPRVARIAPAELHTE